MVQCKPTIMVADALNGKDVLNSATVRFEAAIGAGNTARMGAAAGRMLEFACGGGGKEMSVRAGPPKQSPITHRAREAGATSLEVAAGSLERRESKATANDAGSAGITSPMISAT